MSNRSSSVNMSKKNMLLAIFLASSINLAFSADHDVFKTCAQTDFCSKLRDAKDTLSVPFIKWSYDNDGAVEIDTVNYPILVYISQLEQGSFRVKIRQTKFKTIYALEDSLVNEPTPFATIDSINLGSSDISITKGDLTFRYNLEPFRVEFYSKDVLIAVLGNRIIYNDDGSFAFEVSFPLASQFYGIPAHAVNISLENTANGEPYRLKNLDVSNYELNSRMALYGSVPVLYAHGSERTTGLFVHNAAEQWYDISDNSVYIMGESAYADFFILPGPSPLEVARQYSKLTGTAHLPQLWALGYHQSRYSYDTQEDVKNVVANFAKSSIPLDSVWLDIGHLDEKKYFTWNPENFSDPIELQQNISASHKRLVTIVDPHIKIQKGYSVYDDLHAGGNWFVKTGSGHDYADLCWPGNSSYIDFLDPNSSKVYQGFYSYDYYKGSTPVLAGIWNDMNEPSVFDNANERTMPGDNYHYNPLHAKVTHRDIHNVYALLMVKATHQGLLSRDAGKVRPFILTRSHFAGTQRYAAIWTGDNTADWSYLAVSYAQCLTYNLVGIVFCGADVGGFFGNPSEELLQRWYQAGAWLPFFRAHSNIDTERREPYLFDDSVQAIIRNAIQQRYQHLPVWYSLFYEHVRNGDPVIRPLFFQYPSDIDTYDIDDHLLVGSDILVRAITEPGIDKVQVYFPGDDEIWYSVSSSEVYAGGSSATVEVSIDAIPVYYRAGSIVVTKQTSRLSTDETIDDGYTLIVTPDNKGNAHGTVYIDDFTSFAYEDLEYSYLSLDFDGASVVARQIDDSASSDNFDFVIEAVVINDVKNAPANGEPGEYGRRIYTADAKGNPLNKLNVKGSKYEINLW